MLPNINMKPNTGNNSIIGSRAYTFLDSYVYMKNQRYNAKYQKNKEILAIENNAISIKSANILYQAFMEEARILDSIIIRIRNFALRIKPDVIENINILIPSANAITEFDDVISSIPNIPKYKYIHYNIKPIVYENMASFINLYRMEINAFTSIKTQAVNKDNPFIRDKAAQYLIQTAKEHSNVNKEMLEMEEIKIINMGRLKNISRFFKHKNQFISAVNRDFKTFQFYLRQYSGLREITSYMEPTELRNGDVLLNGSSRPITFNDYFVLYKHFMSMINYMINIIAYHEQQFFNKIYGLQSNIESYANILNEVLDYSKKYEESKNEETSLIESVTYPDTYNECVRICNYTKSNFKSIVESGINSGCYSVSSDVMITPDKFKELGYIPETIHRLEENRCMIDYSREIPEGYFKLEYTYPQNWDMIMIKFIPKNNSLNESISYKLISLDETKSTIDKNFEPKGKLNLSSFEKVHIDENIINKYKKEYPMLKHVRCEDTDDYICDGYMWLDGENLVCTIGSCEYRDTHEKYIVSLEVMDKYKGYGLSKQLLKFAINTMKCSKLSVNKNNEVAKKVYDDFGFKVFHQDDNMYYMEYKSSLNESYDDGLINSDIIDAHQLINGNYAAQKLMYDDTSDKLSKNDDEEVDDFLLKEFLDKNNLELVDPRTSNEINGSSNIFDSVKGVKDEVISNFNEYEYKPDNGGVELCTLRDSLKF